jgi:hypothetical protein
MKYNIIVLLVLISTLSFSQSKKEAKKNKIKSATVMETYYENGNPVTYKDSYEEYDKNGHTLLKIEYKKDGSIKHKETNTYDAFNNKIEETEFDVEKKINKKKTYKYNAFNDKTEETEYDENGKIIKFTSYAYNADGDRSNETIIDGAGKIKKKNMFTYNDKHLKVEKQTYNNTNQLESTKKWSYEFF